MGWNFKLKVVFDSLNFIQCLEEKKFFIMTEFFLLYFKIYLASVIISIKFDLSKKNSGEGNGTPLQYSCLANPMDGGAW